MSSISLQAHEASTISVESEEEIAPPAITLHNDEEEETFALVDYENENPGGSDLSVEGINVEKASDGENNHSSVAYEDEEKRRLSVDSLVFDGSSYASFDESAQGEVVDHEVEISIQTKKPEYHQEEVADHEVEISTQTKKPEHHQEEVADHEVEISTQKSEHQEEVANHEVELSTTQAKKLEHRQSLSSNNSFHTDTDTDNTNTDYNETSEEKENENNLESEEQFSAIEFYSEKEKTLSRDFNQTNIDDESLTEKTISQRRSKEQGSLSIPPIPYDVSDERRDSRTSSFHEEIKRSTMEPIIKVDDTPAGINNRVSVASLGENPCLNDVPLDPLEDEIMEHHEESGGWNFHTPVKTITSLFSSFSTQIPDQHIAEDTDSPRELSFPKTPNSVRSFASLFSLRSIPSATTINEIDSRRMSNASMMSQNSNYDLLLAKIDKENEILTANPRARRMSLQGMEEIKKSFERVQNNITEANDEIDWDFWGQIISDYETIAKSQPRQLSRMIQKGIPPALRGMIWQLMSKSKDAELESTYAQLLKETSPHEKLIMRDLNRTFPKHEYFKDQNGIGQEGLFNVVKAYSLFDKEVGYCQGISFVVGPLLLHMPDEEAFCVLVRLMAFYNMRGHFLPGMDGLQLRLFQFDRLVEEMLPKVHQHLQAQGVNSSMYASQWFMTLFAYKFPLALVLRIYDTIFTEGIEALFRFSIALLRRNEDKIVQMEFETLLEFLKNGLYISYQITPDGTLAKEQQYNTNEFVQDAYSVRITIKKLNKYQQQYHAFQETERQAKSAETIAMERLRISNNQLSNQVKQLEGSLQTLNREHIDIANELINTKMELAKVKDENDTLHHNVNDLQKMLESAPAEVESRLREEMEALGNKNVELIEKNTKLEDHLANLENMLIEIKMRYAESENERELLKRKWNGLKKALG